MSSILKALKKLEEEALHQSTVHPLTPKMGKAGVDRLDVGFSFSLKTIITVCLSVIFLFTAGWFIVNKFTVSAKQNTLQPLLPAKEKATALPKASVQGDSSHRATSNALTVGQIAEQSRQNKGPSFIPDQTDMKPSTASSTEDLPAPDRTMSSGSIAYHSKAPESAPASFIEERTNDSRLKLQAIAWSNTPEKRIAVINDQIVREGGTIQDITVMQILSDQVIFRDGESTFKLTFGLK